MIRQEEHQHDEEQDAERNRNSNLPGRALAHLAAVRSWKPIGSIHRMSFFPLGTKCTLGRRASLRGNFGTKLMFASALSSSRPERAHNPRSDIGRILADATEER